MVCYLELDLWDNIMDGVYSKNHKFLTIAYQNYLIFHPHYILYYL